MTQGEKIKAYRKQKGMTQTELAEACGLAGVTIHQYEAGNREPDRKKLFDLSQALDVSIHDLTDDKYLGKEQELMRKRKAKLSIIIGHLEMALCELQELE